MGDIRSWKGERKRCSNCRRIIHRSATLVKEKKKLPAGGLQRAFWDATAFYVDKGHNQKEAEKLAWCDLELDFPAEVKRARRRTMSWRRHGKIARSRKPFGAPLHRVRAKRRLKRKYKITYLDPNDPRGERIRTWKFKTRKGAERHRADLMTAWKASAREIPIRKVTKGKRP